MSFELTVSKAPGCSNERAQEEDCPTSSRPPEVRLVEIEPFYRSTGELIGRRISLSCCACAELVRRFKFFLLGV
ncbi:hypothetical protein KUL72_32075 [Bradyrhizobium arachidis]|uniref:hypothetical protein n=1 Tax=Bradyrhizobium arachidis TaxID=858423 RepID=UPI0021634042|nr:hypothetical protein [Bradyrhizobium arachidis]UVO35890.1 hypothetical protein KUL72_32075 [Bradyrhizobium arachidis]